MKSMHELADAGCPVIQIEEPQIHLIAVRKIQDKVINAAIHGRGIQSTRSRDCAPRPKCGAHSCWGNPSQQRMFAQVQSYKPALETYNTVDADVITFEVFKFRRRGPGSDRQDDYGQEDRNRRHRSSRRCRLRRRTRWRRKSALHSNTFRPSGSLSRPIAAWAAKV